MALSAEEYLAHFDRWLSIAGVRNFHGYELNDVGRQSKKKTRPILQPAPIGLWVYALPSVLAMERVRAHFHGRRVNVRSGFRDPRYNAAEGGAVNSLHLYLNAFDFEIPGVDPFEIVRVLHGWYPDALGIGLYNDFVHIDTRTWVPLPVQYGSPDLSLRRPARWPRPAAGETAWWLKTAAA